MKTVRRLLYRDIVSSVFFVAVAFLSLFFFIDFVEEKHRIVCSSFLHALHNATRQCSDVGTPVASYFSFIAHAT